MHYIIIGDIHGHYNALEKLLLETGCTRDGLGFKPPGHTAIRFVGDLVDRGPQVRRTLECVVDMVEKGYARTIIGNHELNLLSYCHSGTDGQPLRPHTPKNQNQVSATLHDFEGDKESLEDYLQWIQQQPIVIEEAGFRMAHACWYPPDVEFLMQNFPENRLSDRVLFEYADLTSETHQRLGRIVSGPEISIPEEFAYLDNDGNKRHDLRIAWWNPLQGKTLKQMATHDQGLPEQPIPDEMLPPRMDYDDHEPPLFLGHYCLHGPVALRSSNVACTDFCVIKQKRLAAYHFDGEQPLHENHWHVVYT